MSEAAQPDRVRADIAARAAALDPERSFIVQAPAGSGKTGLLTQRFLALLVRVEEPEEVMAITFTRKAAGEMRGRILEALAAAGGSEPAAAHERRTWELARAVLAHAEERGWRLAATPDRLRIFTIDALNAALTRQMPVLSGFGAPPAIAEDAAELYREAARETLRELDSGAAWGGAVERLLLHLDNNWGRVESLLAEMLARRDQWLRHVADPDNPRVRRETLEAGLRRLLTDALETLHDAFPSASLQATLSVARAAAENLAAAGVESPVLACAGVAAVPEGLEAARSLWLGLAELLLTRSGEWRRRVSQAQGFPAPSGTRDAAEKARRQALKDDFERLVAELGAHGDLATTLHAVRDLPPAAYDEFQWAVLESLFELLPVAVAQLRLVFQARGQVDFTAVAWGALEALGEPEAPTDLALALDYRIRHLLVDEFQDTSEAQFALLERLTAGWEPGDGRTLFLVGDPMQSIYRFREAEVGLFLRAWRSGIGMVALEPLRLSRNFRSQAGVVEWVNDAFARILPGRDDIASGAVAHAGAVATRPGLPEPAVEVHPFLGAAHAAEAARVVRLVQAARAEDPGGRIAVLVRGRTHLAAIAPALKAAGLRFRAIDIEPLGDRPVVQDLLALTRALLHPADRIAWLALLRAPWCGLDLAALQRLAGDAPERTLWTLINEPGRLDSLDPDARERLERVRAVLVATLAGRGRRPLRRWVEGCWLALGGPACVEDHTALADARVYLEMLEGLEEGGDLTDFERLAEQTGKLFARPDTQADESLQLMTIHKSKGLEFDTVILPGLGRSPRRESERLFMWLERPRGGGASDLLIAPMKGSGRDRDPIYAHLYALDRAKGLHEDGRLLYVAVTRARRRVHLLGHVKTVEAGDALRAPPADSLLARLWPVVEGTFSAALEAPAAADDASVPLPPPAQLRLVRDWSRPEPPPAVGWRATAPPTPVEPEVVFEWAGETARHVGTVVHRLLQNMGLQGGHWSAARLASLRPVCRAALARRGVARQALEQAADRVIAALHRCLEDPRGRWILDPGQREARCEYPLTGVLGGHLVHVIMDRTFIDADGVRWIVDYKTSAHEGGGVEAFLDREQERYRDQLERYARLMALREDRPIRLGLYFPLLAGWREWAPGDFDG
ncbi:UvrD-helicase domain-containing protein [Thioalbus denitrificans]|uniref:DNA 3'-5' helicase n=1 Tax=Thioalbus denitrificans TaxID=547122 RepID=A0A369BQM0_9GAMM|nr:UvrD-helicase domain-containing protein [Thioalbus denitrificans]RCX23919.1 ATP-dependent exoDNAse (exonuclease V) beta subunit [Thioalbus denitrificans]